jgi:hypothetical protein
VSLALPALLFRANPAYDGWVLLLMGWIAVLGFNFGWFANFLIVAAWVSFMFKGRFLARMLAVGAVLIAADSVRLVGKYVPLDEANVNKAFVSGFGPGFFLWIASMVLIFAASWPRAEQESGSKVDACSPASKP